MIYVTLSILLICFLYFLAGQIPARCFLRIKADLARAQNDFATLHKTNAKLKQENEELKNTLAATVALYDITKQICKNLDESKVFASFSAEIDKYITVQDCAFIKGESLPEQYKEYTVLPLKIDARHIGYLAASGIAHNDRDKFHILAHQFLLGIRRSLLYEQVQGLAITDGLTGVLSRRFFLERCQEELERSKQFGYNFAFLMVDIDRFKDYNDRYGHLVGDVILKEAARIIKGSLREIDLVGRYGGEEFSIVLTETDCQGALFAAERIRQALESRSIRAYDEDLKATLSIGIAAFPGNGRVMNALIEKADQALYQAKQSGRNKVCVYQQT
jgi:diguanylate cyclase (GGDEF)-like protein